VARWAAICAAPLVLELALFLVIESSGQDFGWKHARMNGLWWLTARQAVTVLVGTGVLADRRGADRAPLLRSRHVGRYVSAADLAELRLNAPRGR